LVKEKPIVDDALISTDVDRLINAISEKRRLHTRELEKIVDIDGRTMDRWLRVLEDEGYVSLEYGLGGTTVIWIGNNAEEEYTEVKNLSNPDETPAEALSEVQDDEIPQTSDNEIPQTSDNETDIKSNILNGLESENPAVSEDHSENEFSKKEPLVVSADSVVSDEKSSSDEALTSVPETEATEPQETADSSESFSVKSDSSGVSSADSYRETASKVQSEPVTKMSSFAANTKDLLNSYMEQIAFEKAEFQKLKQEKDRLYRERYLSLESQAEADFVSITERILAKEGQILSLKEKILELPDRIENVTRIQEIVEKMKTEGQDILARAKEDAESVLGELKQSEAELRERIESSKNAFDEGKSRISELEKVSASLDSNIHTLRDSLENTQSQLREIDTTMKKLLGDLSEVADMKAEIADMTSTVKQSVDGKESELLGLEKQLDKISQVESWINEYLSDYENKMEDLSKYVQASDKDLVSLRKSAEAEYMKKYLHELETMTSNYELGLADAAEKETHIESRMEESKKRLDELLSESRNLISKLRNDTSKVEDFTILSKRLSMKKAEVRSVIEEKGMERDKLKEDVQLAKSGRQVSLSKEDDRDGGSSGPVPKKKPARKKKPGKGKKK